MFNVKNEKYALPSQEYKWKSTSGHAITASIISFKGDSVVLKVTESGKVIEVPISKFISSHKSRLKKYQNENISYKQ